MLAVPLKHINGFLRLALRHTVNYLGTDWAQLAKTASIHFGFRKDDAPSANKQTIFVVHVQNAVSSAGKLLLFSLA